MIMPIIYCSNKCQVHSRLDEEMPAVFYPKCLHTHPCTSSYLITERLFCLEDLRIISLGQICHQNCCSLNHLRQCLSCPVFIYPLDVAKGLWKKQSLSSKASVTELELKGTIELSEIVRIELKHRNRKYIFKR